MNSAVDEIIVEKRDELHEDIVISTDLAFREREQLISNTLKETTDERLTRLVTEYDMNNDVENATRYM